MHACPALHIVHVIVFALNIRLKGTAVEYVNCNLHPKMDLLVSVNLFFIKTYIISGRKSHCNYIGFCPTNLEFQKKIFADL